jgi:hypothetical protein
MKFFIPLLLLLLSVTTAAQKDTDVIMLNDETVIICDIKNESNDSIFYTIDRSEINSIHFDDVFEYYYNFDRYHASDYLMLANSRANKSYIIGALSIAAGVAIIIFPESIQILSITSSVLGVVSLIYQISAWQKIGMAGEIMMVYERIQRQKLELFDK